MMAKEISKLLCQRAEEIARHLMPNGTKQGNEWCVGSIRGEPGKSLKIRIAGEKSGLWCDFACDNHSGDLLELWVKSRNLSLLEAINEATSYLGIVLPSFEGYKRSNFSKPTRQTFSELSVETSAFNYLTKQRKLNNKTIFDYKINQHGQEIVFPYIRNDEIIFVKYLKLQRENNKKRMRVEPDCEPCLFGWNMLPNDSRLVILCEGEIDAMSLYQYGLPALSVPFGAGGGKKHEWIEYEFDRLAMFDEIYICMDNDEAGVIATNELIERLGRHRCRIVQLPLKDANECLQAGIPIGIMQQCITEAKTLDPEELKPANLFVDQVIDQFYPAPNTLIGYIPPWDKTKDKIIFRPEELSIWTGINGHGKSQFLGQIILHAMKQGARVCIASLELKPKRLLMRLTRQSGALANPSKDYIRAIHEWYENKLWVFDLVGTAKSQRLLDVFLYARQRYGIDVFVIDSLMKLDIAEDDYNGQKAFIEQLCDFKNQHNCHIHIVVHPRKGMDESKPPGKLDNKGSGAISDLADNCFAIWRNKNKEKVLHLQSTGVSLPPEHIKTIEDMDCLWKCDKQRNGDWEGSFGFWFDNDSLQYLPHSAAKPERLVEYSKLIK